MEALNDTLVRKHLRLMLKMLLHIDTWKTLSDEERGYLQSVNQQVFGTNAVTIQESDDRDKWIKDVKTYYDHRCMTVDEALAKTKDERLFGS